MSVARRPTPYPFYPRHQKFFVHTLDPHRCNPFNLIINKLRTAFVFFPITSKIFIAHIVANCITTIKHFINSATPIIKKPNHFLYRTAAQQHRVKFYSGKIYSNIISNIIINHQIPPPISPATPGTDISISLLSLLPKCSSHAKSCTAQHSTVPRKVSPR